MIICRNMEKKHSQCVLTCSRGYFLHMGLVHKGFSPPGSILDSSHLVRIQNEASSYKHTIFPTWAWFTRVFLFLSVSWITTTWSGYKMKRRSHNKHSPMPPHHHRTLHLHPRSFQTPIFPNWLWKFPTCCCWLVAQPAVSSNRRNLSLIAPQIFLKSFEIPDLWDFMDEMYDDDDGNDDNSNGDDIVGINSRTVVDASWVGFLRQEHSTAQAENTCPSIPSMRMTTMTKWVRKTTLRNASRAGLGQQSTLDNIFPSFSTLAHLFWSSWWWWCCSLYHNTVRGDGIKVKRKQIVVTPAQAQRVKEKRHNHCEFLNIQKQLICSCVSWLHLAFLYRNTLHNVYTYWILKKNTTKSQLSRPFQIRNFRNTSSQIHGQESSSHKTLVSAPTDRWRLRRQSRHRRGKPSYRLA